VADALAAQSSRFMFATGYDRVTHSGLS